MQVCLEMDKERARSLQQRSALLGSRLRHSFDAQTSKSSGIPRPALPPSFQPSPPPSHPFATTPSSQQRVQATARGSGTNSNNKVRI